MQFFEILAANHIGHYLTDFCLFILFFQSHETYYRSLVPGQNAWQPNHNKAQELDLICYQDLMKSLQSQKRLTIRAMEVAARAAGMATEVILSIGPFRYVCLWMLWKNRCFSKSLSLGTKGGSVILHYELKPK